MIKKSIPFLAAALAFGGVFTAPTFAQDNPPPQQRRQFDPAQFQQMLGDRLKESLNASDDEIKALLPQIQKVMTLQRDVRGGSMTSLFRRPGGDQGGGGRPPGGGFGGDPNAAPSAVQQRLTDLQTAVDNKETKPEELKARIEALRQAKNQARAELAKAQEDLRGLLTQRQEAALITFGILE
jgi:hypothetical protein